MALFTWRRERDSNPRGNSRPPNDLANRPLQPLGYLSLAVGLCYFSRFTTVLPVYFYKLASRPNGSIPFQQMDFHVVIVLCKVVLKKQKRPAYADLFDSLAEGVGFEPTVPLPARRFSRPFPSTARTPFQNVKNRGNYTKYRCKMKAHQIALAGTT